LYKKLDKSLKRYADWEKRALNNQHAKTFHKETDFDIGVELNRNALGLADDNIYEFEYEGAYGYYFVYNNKEAMKGKFRWQRDKYFSNKNYGYGNMKSGYNSEIYSTKNYRLDIIKLVFPTKRAKNKLSKQYRIQFYND
jgi:hypothetical protein